MHIWNGHKLVAAQLHKLPKNMKSHNKQKGPQEKTKESQQLETELDRASRCTGKRIVI